MFAPVLIRNLLLWFSLLYIFSLLSGNIVILKRISESPFSFVSQPSSFRLMVSLCSKSWSWTHDSLISTSPVLRLQTWAATPIFISVFYKNFKRRTNFYYSKTIQKFSGRNSYTSLTHWSLYEYIVNLFVSARCFISKSALSDLSGLLVFTFDLYLYVVWVFLGGWFPPSFSLSIYIFTREERSLEAAYNWVLIVVRVYSVSVQPPLGEPSNKRAMAAPW